MIKRRAKLPYLGIKSRVDGKEILYLFKYEIEEMIAEFGENAVRQYLTKKHIVTSLDGKNLIKSL